LKRLKTSGTAAAGSFAFFLLGVTLWEVRARRVSSPDEVEKGLGIRLVGSLPALHGRSGAWNAPADRRWQSVLIDSVDATRTVLLHASRAESIRVVMVTSALPGEGKSSLSCHLAASLARAGRQTLLIDCDLRRPSIHRLLDQPQGPGVGELLRGEAEVPGVIRRSHAANLDLITAGRWDELAVQALARGDLQAIFDGLRTRYDFVIVDSAPVLPVVDSLLVGQHADAVIFSILRDVSRLPSVQDARDRLTSLGVRVLGAVVSGMRRESYAPRYSPVQLPDGPPAEASA
jgi:capsular exopolysaccharide synthesis family protein